MMALFGYWHMGNRQVFFNEAELRVHKNEILNPKHFLIDYSQGVNGSLMFLIMLPIFIFHQFFNRILQRCSRKLGLYKQMKDFDENWQYEKDINEELGCYWECIPGLD